MVQKIHPRGAIWFPSFHPHAGHLSKKEMTTKLSSMKIVHGLTDLTKRSSHIRPDDITP